LLSSLALPGAARAEILWDGDATRGLGVFKEIQSFQGPITVADDPTYGKVFKIVCNDNGGTKARSEVSYMAGYTLDPKNGDYYVAWRSKWGPLPTKSGKWQVLSQIHHDPAGLGGPVPFGLSVPGDGMMHFNAQDPTGRSYSMWDHPLPLDEWHRYIVHTKMGETLATGYCEIWFDGVKQKLTNGMDRIPCAMSRPNAGSHWKWGVYRSGAGGPIGQSVHYLQHPVLGTTLEDVLEEMPVGGRDAGPGASDAGAAPAPTPADAAPAVDAAATGGNSGAAGAGGQPAGSGGMGGRPGTGGSLPAPEDEPTGGKPAAKASGGCAVGGASPSPLLLLVGLALLRRRRPRR
jgi:MYXO-CTERM domain-containing protein